MSRHHHRAAWRRLRLAALSRDGWRCQRCGNPGRLEVHHRVEANRGGGDDLENLVTVCRGCHLRAHGRRRPSPAARAAADRWRRLVDELR